MDDRRNLLKPCQNVGAVGMGEFYAKTLLNRLYRPFDAHTNCALAAYVMFYVKEHVPSCGKETQLVCIRQGEIWRPYFRDVRDLEDAFRTHSILETRMFHYAIGGLDERDGKGVMSSQKASRKALLRLSEKMLKQARRS